jgi:hypothetical protein
MSNAITHNLPEYWRDGDIGLFNLTFPSIRLGLARWLVLVSFVWPFFNFNILFSDVYVECNFILVLLAAALLPEVALRDKWSILLALPVLAVALIWGNQTAPLRLAIGIVPLLFVLNLARRMRELGQDLVPPNLAYRSLIAFVVFCIVQTVHFRVIPLIPGWLTQSLVAIVPRYMEVPYDDTGVRGVQGWASEPSSAAMACIAFALVTIRQRPERRWSVLALFALLASVNKSIYSLVLLILLGLYCMFTLRRKLYSLLALLPFALAVVFYALHSNRVAELHSNLLTDGVSSESNRELLRFTQILSPLGQFPYVYKPVILFGGLVMEPVGLLPLLVGYGSVMGLLWVACMVLRNLPHNHDSQRPLALFACFILLIMTPPDLIPSIVSLAVFLVPRTGAPLHLGAFRGRSTRSASSGAGGTE